VLPRRAPPHFCLGPPHYIFKPRKLITCLVKDNVCYNNDISYAKGGKQADE